MKRKPSPSQIQALEDVKRTGDPWARVHGQSQHGGWTGVMMVIWHRENWVTYDETARRWNLTTAGETILKEYT